MAAKVGFELMAELDKRIEDGEKKVRELAQKTNQDEGYRPALRRAQKSLNGLKDERAQLRNGMILRGDPFEDPLKSATVWANNMMRRNDLIALKRRALARFGELRAICALIQAIETPSMRGAALLDTAIESRIFNLRNDLARMRPISPKDIELEMQAARELLSKLRQEAEQREKVSREAVEF